MNLTPLEIEQGKVQGWQVCEVWDTRNRKLVLELLPVDFGRVSREQLLKDLTARAKSNDALAIKVLTLIARSNLYKRK